MSSESLTFYEMFKIFKKAVIKNFCESLTLLTVLSASIYITFKTFANWNATAENCFA